MVGQLNQLWTACFVPNALNSNKAKIIMKIIPFTIIKLVFGNGKHLQSSFYGSTYFQHADLVCVYIATGWGDDQNWFEFPIFVKIYSILSRNFENNGLIFENQTFQSLLTQITLLYLCAFLANVQTFQH